MDIIGIELIKLKARLAWGEASGGGNTILMNEKLIIYKLTINEVLEIVLINQVSRN